MSLDVLPTELMTNVVGELDHHSLTKLAQVSKRYRDLAQRALWESVELHRKSDHQDIFEDAAALPTQKKINRGFLDDDRSCPCHFEDEEGNDTELDRRNSKFGTMIRRSYRSAGKSKAWERLAPLVRHLCLTVTSKSPPKIWDMVLSLPHLKAVEMIGQRSVIDSAVGRVKTFRRSRAKSVQIIRLRGYIPGTFMKELCRASASSVVSMDLAVFDDPELFEGDEESMELQEEIGFPVYFPPREIQWCRLGPAMAFNVLTHLHLCRGETENFGWYPGWDSGTEFLEEVYDAIETQEYQQWASLLQSVRSTIVEVILEQRKVIPEEVFHDDPSMGPHSRTAMCPHHRGLPVKFLHEVLMAAFEDGNSWPKLEKLTLYGVFAHHAEEDKIENIEAFAARALPGVDVAQKSGHYMFWDTDSGEILNQSGADGLKPRIHCREVFADSDDE